MKYKFTIICFAALAILASCNKKNEPETVGTVNDICGNTYKYVKIGEQYWMAENMRCNKYDTKSERAGATISTSSSSTYDPYYTDASNRSNWKTTQYSWNLSDEQISKLGYLYSWAAAVGIASESAAKNQTSSFSGTRQGICPNGWHVPTSKEWESIGRLGDNNPRIGGMYTTTGELLKTTSGWTRNNGNDIYSFAALPTGYATGSTVNNVGGSAHFWITDPHGSNDAFYSSLSTDSYLSVWYRDKSNAYSVRCVKN